MVRRVASSSAKRQPVRDPLEGSSSEDPNEARGVPLAPSRSNGDMPSSLSVPYGGSDNRSVSSGSKVSRRRKKRGIGRSNGGLLSSFLSFLTNSSRQGRNPFQDNNRGDCTENLENVSIGFLVAGLSLALFVVVGVYSVMGSTESRRLSFLPTATDNIPRHLLARIERPTSGDDLPILLNGIPSGENPRSEIHRPPYVSKEFRKQARYVDYGDVHLRLLMSDTQERQIYRDTEELQGEARSLGRSRDDDYDAEYYAFDDDYMRNPYLFFEDDMIKHNTCRRVNWHRYNFPACNAMHELNLAYNIPKFVGDGAYREVFVTQQPYLDTNETVIFKELRWDLDMKYDDFEFIRMDALVSERLTYHPNIVDIYGFCGFSMLSEYLPNGDMEDVVVGHQKRKSTFDPLKEKRLNPRNHFTPSEKLQLALDMVEPVMALHNFQDGVIVHDDIQLVQYLWTDESKTRVKLNDFNRAEIMLYDEENQQYCSYTNGKGHGDWRAPEEYGDKPLNEKIDLWSLGNNFYSVLTGLYPFYNVENDRDIQKKVKKGEKAVIDPRYRNNSYAEAKLVEVIERCYEFEPSHRASATELYNTLKDAIGENKRRPDQQQKSHQRDKAYKKDRRAGRVAQQTKKRAAEMPPEDFEEEEEW